MTYSSNWFYANRKNLVLTFSSIFITLIIGEAGLQFYYRLSNKSWLWQYNNFHVTYIKPVEDRRQYTLRPDFSDSQIGISINSKGFRAPVSMAEPDAETPVLVSLGDSKAFGVGARDEETYPFYIAQKLRKDGSSLHTVNAGIPSYNMRQALDRFRIDVLPNYNPKVITLQGTFNDISLLTFYRENWNPDRTWADIRYAGFVSPLPGFQKIATLYYLNLAIRNTSQNSPPVSHGNVEYQTYPDEEMLRTVRGEIEEFLVVCRQKSIPVVLIPIDPFYYQTNNLDKNPALPFWDDHTKYIGMWQEMLLHYDNMLFELSRKHDSVYFFDARKYLDAADRRPLFADFLHYSPEGNRLVAEGLYDFMKEKGLLDQKIAP